MVQADEADTQSPDGSLQSLSPVEDRAQDTSPAKLSLLDRPTIAVLPFINMSGEPEQEYFSEGISEDIITAL